MSLYTVYTVILSIIVYAEISRGQEDPAEMEILGSQHLGPFLPIGLTGETRQFQGL